MTKVTPPPIIFYPLTFAGGTALFAGAGWLGAHVIRVLFASTAIPAAHAVAIGLWAPATLALCLLAAKINSKGGSANYTFGLLGGYMAAIVGANKLGYSVTFIGPILGISILPLGVAGLAALIAPLALLGLALANANNKLRDFLLRAAN